MSTDRVMLLIDADNVSLDVMEQAVALLLQQHGALHVRRAYCTAESAVKHQSVFKRLGIKPMVNLATGKNSTDIALAVDALDLVLAERPDVVAIASSDSDFAPLVGRLREKGCRVVGFGQQGKTGDETLAVYDVYTVLEHRKGAAASESDTPPRKTARRAPAAKKAVAVAAKPAAAKKAPAARKSTRAAASPAAKEVPVPAAAKTAARKSAARKTGAAVVPAVVSAVLPAVMPAVLPAVAAEIVPAVVPAAASTPAVVPAVRRSAQGRGPSTLSAVLDCLPELTRGQGLALNVAVQRLREAQLLGKNSSSLKLFSQLSDRFELLPADKPSQVRLRR